MSIESKGLIPKTEQSKLPEKKQPGETKMSSFFEFPETEAVEDSPEVLKVKEIANDRWNKISDHLRIIEEQITAWDGQTPEQVEVRKVFDVVKKIFSKFEKNQDTRRALLNDFLSRSADTILANMDKKMRAADEVAKLSEDVDPITAKRARAIINGRLEEVSVLSSGDWPMAFRNSLQSWEKYVEDYRQ